MSDSKRHLCKLILKRDYLIFFDMKNVVGIAFGYKITNGLNTNEPCIKVFVTTKEPPSSLNSDDSIPEIYENFKTDVVQCGELSYSSLKEKNLPLKFGYSIGPSTVKDVGSSGCLVKDCCGNHYILSANHVLSYFDELPIGTPILHPGVKDGGKYPDDLIATLSKKISALSTDEDKYLLNYVDCAIAKITNPSLVSNKIFLIDNIKGVADADINLNVKKIGRTTELTTGKVIALDAILKISNINSYEQIYHDQIITTCMSDKGDSGSILLDDDNNAIGLLFAKGDSISIANSIKAVLTALNVRIVTS